MRAVSEHLRTCSIESSPNSNHTVSFIVCSTSFTLAESFAHFPSFTYSFKSHTYTQSHFTCREPLSFQFRLILVLKLSGCGWAGQEAMTNLFTATSALEHVDLTGCWACGDASVTSALVLHNPHLKSLSLANIYGLRDDSIEMLARQSSLLECLDLRYHSSVLRF